MPGIQLPGGSQPFTDANQERTYIVNRAQSLGIDPQAVLAVAAHEGVTLPAQVGDNGTSFGPWQLHIGGALPASVAAQGADYAQAWANSPTGIDYALGRIASFARGQKGAQAIRSIVYSFERPKNPAAEYSAAVATYNGGGGPSNAPGSTSGSLGGALDHIPGVAQIESVGKFLGKITDPAFLLRALEVMGGGILILLGLYLLAKQIGLAPDAPAIASAAAKIPVA